MKEIIESTTKFVLVIIIIAIITLSFLQIKVEEPLNNIALMVVTFYFWQKVGESKTAKKLDEENPSI